jgi:predicted ATPase
MVGVCPLSGRRTEVGTLGSALERAAAGAGGIIALLGDEGVGKTRLLEELQEMARARGALVLAGRAWAMHTRLAYALLVDALGPHLRELAPADRERLVDDLPELDNLFVELPRRALEPLGDPDLEKTRLFEAFCRLVERLAQSRTVVLALDDVQWADQSASPCVSTNPSRIPRSTSCSTRSATQACSPESRWAASRMRMS